MREFTVTIRGLSALPLSHTIPRHKKTGPDFHLAPLQHSLNITEWLSAYQTTTGTQPEA